MMDRIGARQGEHALVRREVPEVGRAVVPPHCEPLSERVESRCRGPLSAAREAFHRLSRRGEPEMRKSVVMLRGREPFPVRAEAGGDPSLRVG
jgi:hypothetical protein